MKLDQGREAAATAVTVVAESKLPTRCEGNGANSKALPLGLLYQGCCLIKKTLACVPSSLSSVIPDPVKLRQKV